MNNSTTQHPVFSNKQRSTPPITELKLDMSVPLSAANTSKEKAHLPRALNNAIRKRSQNSCRANPYRAPVVLGQMKPKFFKIDD